MKKITLWGLAALPLLMLATSCQNESVESKSSMKNSFVFKAAVNKQTRASELQDWQEWSILPLHAYNQAGPYFSDDLQYIDWTWIFPSGGYYEFTGEPVTFYSWYPGTSVSNEAMDFSAGTLDYVINDDPAQQVDFVVASNRTTTSRYVNLEFNHVLSQINFAVATPEGGCKVKIDSLKINGVCNAGTLNMAPGGMAWSNQSGYASYGYNPADSVASGDYGSIVYLGNGGYDYTHDNALMLMPQTFTDPYNGHISFSYSVYGPDADIESGALPILSQTGVRLNLSDFTTSEWNPGKRYVYLFDFSNTIETGEFNFSVTLNNWEDASVVDFGTEQDTQAAEIKITSMDFTSAFSSHAYNNEAHPMLKRFPIVCHQDPRDGFTYVYEPDQYNTTKFDAGDQLIITFPSVYGANCFGIGNAFDFWWSQSPYDTNPVVLTKRSRDEFYQAADPAELKTVIDTINNHKAADPSRDVFRVLYTQELTEKISIDQIAPLFRDGNVLTDNLYNQYDAICIYFEQNYDLTDMIELTGDATIAWNLSIYENMVYITKRNLATPYSGYIAGSPMSVGQLPYLNDISYSFIECPDVETWFLVFGDSLTYPFELTNEYMWQLDGMYSGGKLVLIFPDNESSNNFTLGADVPAEEYTISRLNDTMLVIDKGWY